MVLLGMNSFGEHIGNNMGTRQEHDETPPKTKWVKKIYAQTSWSLLGPGVEVGLVPNIMKGINILMANVIKDFSYNLWQNNSSVVKERQQERK